MEDKTRSAYLFEVAVSTFLVTLAVLWKFNTAVIHSNVLFLLSFLLTVNLGEGIFLRSRQASRNTSFFLVVLNGAIITAILHYSGGFESRLWALYFLPIFAAPLLLNETVSAATVLILLTMSLVFFIKTAPILGVAVIFSIVLRMGVLALGAVVCWRLVHLHRADEELIEAQRQKLDKLVRAMIYDGSGSISREVAHDLRTPLFVIQGTAELLSGSGSVMPATKKDFQRITRSVKRCINVIDKARGRLTSA